LFDKSIQVENYISYKVLILLKVKKVGNESRNEIFNKVFVPDIINYHGQIKKESWDVTQPPEKISK
jgi:hypothetical protein